MKLRILTFNWHEGYIHLLAKTGYEFDVVERWKGGRYGWIKEFRPVPQNCNLISEDEAKTKLGTGYYDRIIAHNIHDFVLVSEDPTPKVLLHHNKFEIETNFYDKTKKEETLQKLRSIYDGTKNLTLVFVSKGKKDSWGLDGEVILLSADHNDYGDYNGDIEKVLRIGNLLKERDGLLGYSIQERILKDLPSTILGLNPAIEGAILPSKWDEFKEFLRNHRVYLHTTTQLDDGYNCSMLEVMATGMPVVSISNPSSPIEDGVNGFVSDNPDYLCERIKELLRNQRLARSIGQKAMETVMDKFPVGRFIKEWKRVLEGPENFYTSKRKSKNHESSQDKRLKILMSYTSNPQTTAAYMEKALRRHHDVITYGPTVIDEEIKTCKLEAIRDRVKDHDIPYCTPDINRVVKTMLSGWVPDLFLWVDSSIWYPLERIKSLPCLTACYLIDVHLNISRRLNVARAFDYVFIAQKEYMPHFKAAGIEHVFWLPLACDPEIHGKKGDDKLHDIGFVGSLNNQRRFELLNKLKERFNVYYERCFLERMAEVFSQSRIVFNVSVKNDLNMRVFEALCSGSMLLTDEARGSGLSDMFRDRKNLAIYRDEDELFELADYYLKNNEERERIAEEGRREVLSRHTYEHRMDEMVKVISSFLCNREKEKGEARKTDQNVQIENHPVESRNIEESNKKEDILKRPSPLSHSERPNILMASLSSPVSSPHYYEKGLRKFCNVITFGPYRDRSFWVEHALSLKSHQFYREGSATNWIDVCSRLTRPCDITVPRGVVDMRDILKRLPNDFRPDLFIWIDQHGENIPVNIDSLDCPTLALFGDTHIGDMTWRLNYSLTYDYVFLMFNKHHMPLFKQAGCQKVFWSPAACDPEIHCKISAKKDFSISFVGSTHPILHHDRVQLLEFIKRHGIDIYIDSKVHQEMSKIFSRSKMVLNRTIADDLNQRVFEVLGTGSLLLTNRLNKESGLEDLFTDKEHLVIYDDPDSLIELINYYLNHEKEREAIALAGYEEVIKKHTYNHRVQEIISIIKADICR